MVGGGAEEHEREADPERGEHRELQRRARVLGRAAGLAAGQRDAGQRGDRRRSTAACRGARRRSTPAITGTIALVATIGATTLIVPSASAR